MALSDDFLNELRMRVDIESVISPYVQLKRRGKNLVGLCPFHNEKTPSFTVYPETQSFYCFGCGAGGEAITFLRRIENLDFMDAVKLLADKAGISMPADGGYDDTLSKKRRRMLEINRAAARFFNQTLMSQEGAEALEYLLKRGLTKKTVISFGLGYAPARWDGLLKHMQSLGYSGSELYEANLVNLSRRTERKSYYDNFRGRLMFPLIDTRGNVTAFSGRVLDDSKPKYINTSDTLVYKKGNGLYGLNFAKNGNAERKLILVEGNMDVIALHQAGFTNAVACLGTALTPEQAKIVSKYADEVIISYDNDEAGQKAASRAMGIFSKTGIKIRVLALAGGKDPDEIIKNHGKERFKALLDGAANDTEYKILVARKKFDPSTDDGKVGFLNAAADILAAIGNSIEREVYTARLADELGIAKEAIRSETAKRRKAMIKRTEKKAFSDMIKTPAAPADSSDPERKKNLLAAKAEDIIIVTLMNNPDFFGKTEPVSEEDFITSFNRRLFAEVRRRIEAGQSTDISFFAGAFTPEEMGRIALLQTMSYNISNSVAECNDCIKTLKNEKAKLERLDPAAAQGEDFLKLFRK